MSIERVLWEQDVTGLAELVHKGEISPPELVDAAIARAEATRPDINAIATPLYDAARARAKATDRKLPLAGVPFALKDLGIGIKGVPIHGGSRIPAFTADFNSVMVERYLAAGLIPIATSTSPEHGLRLMTESARFGITRNPWNTGHTTGGSSGGSAALVAAGVVPAAHASDGGGSIRVPSACSGLVGLKTSRGRVPLTPLTSETWYGMVVDHAISRSVRDTALLLDLTHGADPLSPYAAREPKGSFAAAAARDPGKLSLAIYRKSPLGLPISAETLEALDTAVALAREGGHTVDEIDLPYVGRDFMADFCKSVASAVAGMMRAEALRVGRPVSGEVERATRVLGRLGEMLSAGEVYDAVQRLNATARRMIEETARFDAVLMPIIAHPPLVCGSMDPKGADELIENLLDKLHLTGLLRIKSVFGQLMDKSLWFTHWPAIHNVSGQPSIAMPVHVTADGLPLGIQAAGRPGDEETLLSFAAQMEKISGWLKRRAPLKVPG
ncbi:amidase [Mesorhizobium sp. VK23B]|uniref:Indoleacetamide hydrolase n=1 Tax=Mesorhizobium dulcispinae TaxID=3072316 RepID=A0ABU4XJ07_9HYPH|nr:MULTISPECIES: amidase [unclassified Mesorhizobium]MDX8468408.1 amidase [Mesorhizobium sp. VK23B]MDX8474746.1 amidase [Mesorhizobium sp. VK23A]